MPTSDRVQICKNQHGDQHQGVGWDADSVDLGHVEALGPITILDGFLVERKEERMSRSVCSPGELSARDETHQEENEPSVRILTPTPCATEAGIIALSAATRS